MKKYPFLVLAILFSMLAIGQKTSVPEGSIVSGKFLLNNKEISKDWKLQTVNGVLGNVDRGNEGAANRVYLHDKNGIVIYEAKKNGKATGIISEFSIYFSVKESSQLIPYNTYPGTFEIEGMRITKNSKWTDISNALKEKGYKKQGDYRYSKNGLYMIFRYSDDGLLQNISMGKG